MLFERYQQDEPENNQIIWFAVLSLALLPLILYLVFEKFLPGLRVNGQMNHTIRIDEKQLRRADELCMSLPRPEKLDLTGREERSALELSGDPTTVIYRYESGRGAEEIMPAFILWFEANGWRQIPGTSTFEKDSRRVYISARTGHIYPNQYDIYCSAGEQIENLNFR